MTFGKIEPLKIRLEKMCFGKTSSMKKTFGKKGPVKKIFGKIGFLKICSEKMQSAPRRCDQTFHSFSKSASALT